MAGIFVTFLVEFLSHRFFGGGHSRGGALSPTNSDSEGKTHASDAERVEAEASTGRTLVINVSLAIAALRLERCYIKNLSLIYILDCRDRSWHYFPLRP